VRRPFLSTRRSRRNQPRCWGQAPRVLTPMWGLSFLDPDRNLTSGTNNPEVPGTLAGRAEFCPVRAYRRSAGLGLKLSSPIVLRPVYRISEGGPFCRQHFYVLGNLPVAEYSELRLLHAHLIGFTGFPIAHARRRVELSVTKKARMVIMNRLSILSSLALAASLIIPAGAQTGAGTGAGAGAGMGAGAGAGTVGTTSGSAGSTSQVGSSGSTSNGTAGTTSSGQPGTSTSATPSSNASGSVSQNSGTSMPNTGSTYPSNGTATQNPGTAAPMPQSATPTPSTAPGTASPGNSTTPGTLPETTPTNSAPPRG
jgi:hypothetical protein